MVFVSKDFENAVISEFQDFSHKNFTVELFPAKLFLCGGPYGGRNDDEPLSAIPRSVREAAINSIYSDRLDKKLEFSIILAEDFKDYFKENAYPDLLAFEDDIAKLSTLIVIFLESAGSYVEFGLFCHKEDITKKLLTIVPTEEVDKEDSFIFLGPLSYLKRLDPLSVSSYPFSKYTEKDYKEAKFIANDIVNRLASQHRTESFKYNNSGHVALLIFEIISLCYPIKLEEIEFSLAAMEIDLNRSYVLRLIYLLQKMMMVGHHNYSNVKYYYPLEDSRRIRFGRDKNERKTKDVSAIKISIKKTWVLSEKEVDQKRQRVMEYIQNRLKGGNK